MSEKHFFLNQGEFISPHSVILDRLNFWNYNEGRRVYYDSSEFEKALPSLKERPVIFARKHADPQRVLSNLDDAVKAVDGKLVGSSIEVSINNTGSPKLCAELDITDPDVDQMITNGEVYLSHAFDGRLDAKNRIYDITGNHILIYPTDTGIPPGDQIATFLNQSSEGIKMPEDTKTDDTREFFMNQYQEQVQLASDYKAEVENQKITIQNQGTKIQDLEAKVSELTEKATLVEDHTITIQNQGTKINALEEELTTLRAEKLESEKKAFMNQFAVGVQKEFAERVNQEFGNPAKQAWLVNDMWKAQSGIKEPPTEPSGEISVLNQGEVKTSGVSVVKNPLTGKLEAKVITVGA